MVQRLVRIQRTESQFEQGSQQTRTQKRVKHRRKESGQTLGKLSIIDINDYELAKIMIHYFQVKHVPGKPRKRDAEVEQNLKQASKAI